MNLSMSEEQCEKSYQMYGTTIARVHDLCVARTTKICFCCSEPIGEYCKVTMKKRFEDVSRFLCWVHLPSGDIVGDNGFGKPDHSWKPYGKALNVWDEEPFLNFSGDGIAGIIFSGFTYQEMIHHIERHKKIPKKYTSQKLDRMYTMHMNDPVLTKEKSYSYALQA